MSTHDWIPSNLEKFQEFAENFVMYVKKHNAVWTHIPAEEVIVLFDLYETFFMTYKEAIRVNSTANRQQRNDDRVALTHKMREIRHLYLDFPQVTNKDKIAMGLKIKDTTPTSHTEVRWTAEFRLSSKSVNTITIRYFVDDTNSSARPADCTGLFVVWAFSDTEPLHLEDYNFNKILTRSPSTLEFDTHDSGKRVWFRMAWITRRVTRGRFAEAQSFIIP